MNELKKCVQCNELKPVDGFREYTHSRHNKDKQKAARYRICKDCENINTRYYRSLVVLNEPQNNGMDKYNKARIEYDKILRLYTSLELRGCRTPIARHDNKTNIIDEVDRLLQKLELEDKTLPVAGKRVVQPDPVKPEDIPSELKYWLGDEWMAEGLSPEFYQETIYESLKNKYRPQIGIDKDRGVIIYDDTYKAILNDILRKFDEYEDNYVE